MKIIIQTIVFFIFFDLGAQHCFKYSDSSSVLKYYLADDTTKVSQFYNPLCNNLFTYSRMNTYSIFFNLFDVENKEYYHISFIFPFRLVKNTNYKVRFKTRINENKALYIVKKLGLQVSCKDYLNDSNFLFTRENYDKKVINLDTFVEYKRIDDWIDFEYIFTAKGDEYFFWLSSVKSNVNDNFISELTYLEKNSSKNKIRKLYNKHFVNFMINPSTVNYNYKYDVNYYTYEFKDVEICEIGK